MLEIIILSGLPASNKTTWAKGFLQNNPNYKRINKDDLRVMLDNSRWNKQKEEFILKMRDLLIINCLENGYSVIVDDTNLHPKHTIKIKEIANSFGQIEDGIPIVQVTEKFFDVELYEAIRRDASRGNKSVGEKVIRKMYNQFIVPMLEKNYIIQDKKLQKAIICDIDGTIAIAKDRGPFEWNKVSNDLPKNEIINIVKMYYNNGYQIIFLSGRKDCCMEDTKKWICKNVCIMWWILRMRKSDDNRKDSIVKKELFEQNIKDKYFVELVIDDRKQVVDMWRDLGLTCAQIDRGEF